MKPQHEIDPWRVSLAVALVLSLAALVCVAVMDYKLAQEHKRLMLAPIHLMR